MSATSTTITTTKSMPTMSRVATGRDEQSQRGKIRIRRIRRRLSAPSPRQAPLKLCRSLPYTLEALNLSSASPTQTLASLRFLVLSYLADLERRLTELGSDFEVWKLQGEHTIDEATLWARTALDMLEGIRADVCSHLPELPFVDLSKMEEFVKSHLPDLPHLPDMVEMRSCFPDLPHLPDIAEMRSRLPDMPSLPDMDDVRTHFSEMRLKLDDVRTRFHEIDFRKPFGYIPTLLDHLENLHSHLSIMEVPPGLPPAAFTPNTVLSDLLDSLLNSDVVQDILNSTPAGVISEGEDILERAAHDVANAIRRSLEGVHLISYSDLPHQWRNNPFVTHGYRFIPIERWPLLIMSLFSFHNETLNIHTHLVPFLLWGINLISLINNTYSFDVPELLFTGFALLCLLSSALWHTMSGCADHRSMDICARVDYVGIGWLISASVGTVVHYGFQCYPSVGYAFLGLCFVTGMAGNIFPFMAWFNQHEYRLYRVAFFLAMAFSAIGPMIAMSVLHTRREMLGFVAPVVPSLISYLIGLAFYAAHFPERVVPANVQRRLDMVGCGSHAIWHCFIVLAVSQHKSAIESMKNGLQCMIS